MPTKIELYVFSIDLEKGIEMKGRITHENRTDDNKDYYYDYQAQIRRSLYIEKVLYTLSQRMIKANSLENLSEINTIILSIEELYPRPIPLTEDMPTNPDIS